MDAQEAIRLLRERTEHEVTLPAGPGKDEIPAIVKLPNLQECILAGGVPMPVLERMSRLGDTNGDAPKLNAEDIEHLLRFRREVARQTLVGLWGERFDVVTPEIIDALSGLPDAFDAVVAIGNREPGNLLNPTEASVPA